VRFGTKAVAGASARAFGRVWIFAVLFCIPRRSSAGHAGRVLAYRAAFSPTGAAGAATLLAGSILFAEAQRRIGLPLGVASGGVREGCALALFRESVTVYG